MNEARTATHARTSPRRLTRSWLTRSKTCGPLLLAVAALGLTACDAKPTTPAGEDPAATDGALDGGPDGGPGEEFLNAMGDAIADPLTEQLKAAAAAGPAVEPPQPIERPSPSGRPVERGEAVSVAMPLVKGAEARHRITVHTKTTLRNDNSVSARRVIYYTKSRVTSGDGSGRARVRFEITRLRYAFTVGADGVIEIDSAEITDGITKLLNDNQGVALAVRPDLALVGKPLEFGIAATGQIENVEGADGWREAFLNAVAEIDPKAVAEAAHAPTAELLADTWAHYLFPPLGGGELAGGATRKLRLREDTFQKQYVVHPVKMSVTHVSDTSFIAEGTSTAEGEAQLGQARSQSQQGIFKTRIVPASSGDHFWEVDRATGFVERAFHRAHFQIWVAYSSGANQKPGIQGQTNPDAFFTIIEREISVARDDRETTTDEDKSPDGPPDTGDASSRAGEDETAAADETRGGGPGDASRDTTKSGSDASGD